MEKYIHIFKLAIDGKSIGEHTSFYIKSNNKILSYNYVCNRIEKEMQLKKLSYGFVNHILFYNN